MTFSQHSSRELEILEHIENDPNITQAGMAESLGVAVGTVNFTVKRLVKKGYVRVKRLERKRLKYIITPDGIALRSKLALESLQYSMRLYRETRTAAKRLIREAQEQGFDQLAIVGEGDLADIINLTCLELGMRVMADHRGQPIIMVTGSSLRLVAPDERSDQPRVQP